VQVAREEGQGETETKVEGEEEVAGHPMAFAGRRSHVRVVARDASILASRYALHKCATPPPPHTHTHTHFDTRWWKPAVHVFPEGFCLFI
jgi:hypothetical protein